MADTRASDKLAVILHADVAGSTALVQQDEHLAHEHIQDTFRRLGDTIARYHGHVRELRGDALLGEFDRASAAVTAALSFQADQDGQNARVDEQNALLVRIGIAMGEVVIADNTITGAGVVLAQRLEQLAEPGSVCITGAIHEALPQRLPFYQETLGEQMVKGFDEPVRAYSVRLADGATLPEPDKHSKTRLAGVARWLTIAMVVVSILGGAGLLVWLEPWAPDLEPASEDQMAFPLPDKPSIAVLAFDNLTGDTDKAYLSDGISENIITELSRFPQLFVIARQSSFSYKGKPVTVRQVSEELGVRYVLEGSVQTSNDRMRVTVQLVNALDGNHIWAESYDRELEDFFAVQDEIASTVVVTLKSNIDLSEFDRVKGKPTESLSAYEAWAVGNAHWFKYTEEDNERARELFERARELDPDYADAYRGLAWVYINGYRWGWSGSLSRERALELAFEMARRGVELAPYNHRLHQALAEALLQAGKREEALVALEKALKLNPNDASVLAHMSSPLMYAGHPDQAVAQIERAIRLNPYHPDWYLWNLAYARYYAGDYDGAIESINQMKKMPNLARLPLAAANVRLDKVDEAEAVVTELLSNDPDYSIDKLRLNFKGKFANPKDLEQLVDDIRTAGVPEH